MTAKHPRRARLGLIEAKCRKTRRRTARQRIRGARASASLKHQPAVPGMQVYFVHPRRARLGLIEAT